MRESEQTIAALSTGFSRLSGSPPAVVGIIAAAHQVAWTLADRSEPIRFLIRDK
jgi:hypothetical protein